MPLSRVRTYADRLSPKVVQALLDLLCSQLKTLLSQAAGSVLSSSPESEEKTDAGTDNTKKDFRGNLTQNGVTESPNAFQHFYTHANKPACVWF